LAEQRTKSCGSKEVIKSYEILDFKSGESFYFLKVKTVLIDDSELHINE
jgi:hypothetical protein